MSGLTEYQWRAILEQLRTSEGRLLDQVEEIGLAHALLLQRIDKLRAAGSADIEWLQQVSDTVGIAVAEVKHAATAWRRAIDRVMTDTQPIDLGENG